MIAVAGGILLAILFIFLLPLILELIPILLGAALILIAVILVFTGVIPLEIVLVGMGLLFAGRMFDAFENSRRTSSKTSSSYSLSASKSNNNLNSKNTKFALQSAAPRSKKIEFQKKIRFFRPAFTNHSALQKLKELKELDDQQLQYGKLALQNGSTSLDNFSIYLSDHFSKQFQVYVDNDLLRLVVNRSENSPNNATFRCDISIYLDDQVNEIASVRILVRAISNKKSIRTISLFLSKPEKTDLHGISINRVVRRINKSIVSELKKKPHLIDKIEMTKP